MEERAAAWKELSELKDLELVGSLSYNIEINAAGVNKGTALVALGKMLGIPRNPLWHAETVTTMSIFCRKSVLA